MSAAATGSGTALARRVPAVPPVNEPAASKFGGMPDLPPVPPALAGALAPTERRLLFSDTGYRAVERWAPTRLPGEAVSDALALARELREAVRPAERPALLARVLALLSHYRSEPNPPQVEIAIADDWAQDLGEFPIWAVEEAARTWRRTRKFKPQICEIRDLCEAACARHAERLRKVEALLAFNSPVARRVEMVAVACVRRLP